MERSSGAAPPLDPGSGGPQSSTFTVRIEQIAAGATIVALAGELDLSVIRRMEPPLLEQVRQRSAVLVDLTELSFIDSSGIGVLIRAFQESDGVPMQVLVGQGSHVERVFQVAGVTDALPVHRDRESALAALGAD